MRERMGNGGQVRNVVFLQIMFRQTGRAYCQIKDFGDSRSDGTAIFFSIAQYKIIGTNTGLTVGWTCQIAAIWQSAQRMRKFNGIAYSIDIRIGSLQVFIHPNSASVANF